MKRAPWGSIKATLADFAPGQSITFPTFKSAECFRQVAIRVGIGVSIRTIAPSAFKATHRGTYSPRKQKNHIARHAEHPGP